MKKKRFSVEQVVATLKQIELEMTAAVASRQLGVSEQAIYRWKRVYGGLQSDQARELELLQEENARLKKRVAELSLDKAILKDINSKNGPPRGETSGSGLGGRPRLDESPAAIQPKISRQRNTPISGMIENWRDVRRAIASSEFASDLDALEQADHSLLAAGSDGS